MNPQLTQIPKLPGVYIFKDNSETIIYIGKAINLYNRVKSYFTKSNNIKSKVLVKKINKIEYFITNNEVEALLLENNLIKQNIPKYNIQLRDAKTYPMLKITNEKFPRIIKCREKLNEKDQYYGPFINADTVRSLQKIFTEALNIRTCKKKFTKSYNSRPCLNYFIGRCSGPCTSKISEEEYSKSINMAKDILNGNTKKIIKFLKEKMENSSENLEFEQAGKIRDQIKILEEFDTSQPMDIQKHDNCDYIGIYNDFNKASISLIQQMNGKIIGKKNFMLINFIDYTNILLDFLNTYYLNSIESIPDKIIIPQKVEGIDILVKAIKKKFSKEVKILQPVDQHESKLIILAIENAEIYFEEQQYKLDRIHDLRELKKVLNLKELPRIIEGFDVATLNGKQNTAAMVSFIDGKPNKSGYRQFNISDRKHPDDYSMMEEVIARRYQRLKNEKLQLPSLIMVDGGKGQVSSALKILKILQLDIPVAGLAKKNEYIYFQNKNKPLILDRKSNALKLLQRIRDEAHRFSNTRLVKRHTKESITTSLKEIEGLGETRINGLFKKFGSIKSLYNASIEEITTLEGFGIELAKKIFEYLHNEK